MKLNIIAQLFGAGAMLSLFLLYQQKDRKRLMICKLCADVFWVAHYLCLGAYGGLIPNFVGIFRELVFMNRDRKKWAGYWFWPVLFIIINWALGIATFRTPINILPIAASTLITAALWFREPTVTKLVSAPVSASFLVYDIFVGSWTGVVNESISLLSIALFFIRKLWRKKNVGK